MKSIKLRLPIELSARLAEIARITGVTPWTIVVKLITNWADEMENSAAYQHLVHQDMLKRQAVSAMWFANTDFEGEEG